VTGSPLLTLAEVAERVQLSTWALRRAIDRGELIAFRPCGRIRVAESALAAWLDSTATGAEAKASKPRRSRRVTGTDTFRSRERAQARQQRDEAAVGGPLA
jgi:excisionase family DNA binding protein